jgi:pilus assembly protein Flp/PilA
MFQNIRKFIQEEEGLTTVEYAVAGALVSLAVVGAFQALGGAVITTIGAITTAI